MSTVRIAAAARRSCLPATRTSTSTGRACAWYGDDISLGPLVVSRGISNSRSAKKAAATAAAGPSRLAATPALASSSSSSSSSIVSTTATRTNDPSSRRGTFSGAEPTNSIEAAATTTTTGTRARTPLPSLSRPLGVKQRPSAHTNTWEELREDMMDQSKRMDQRRVLIQQATQGYFNDYHRLGDRQGKSWIGPKTLIKSEQALYFPNMEGTRLTPKEPVHTTSVLEGKVSLVAMLSTQASQEHVESFAIRTISENKDNPHFQYVQINLQENPLKSFIIALAARSLRKQIPEHLQSTYILSHQNMELFREPMGMENRHVGYVYLVDQDGKIRWAGCSHANPEEIQALAVCTDVLLKRAVRSEGVGK
ncbi:ATP10 protein-domain-containing protein [Cantharellus anzutake]|uniref:ATP10 protein-domain-containing protein n=1 Tax=Cantharellus anzutake TaxID=1750568 RepID=UPI001908DEF1|nr:ATP10 protein-domain-containing protein [Cantharellus anzutake]KAF8342767.1 ATP10 protein-domain-containing protein [Cantharellus anzutake]